MPLTPEREQELTELCRRFRIEALTAIHGAQSGHPGGSLSVCEILTLLYQERMNVSAAKAADPDRDRLILSKGHAAPMLYVNLMEKGFLPKESLMTLRAIDSELQGHPCTHTPGVEMPAGPLGLGLSAAQGMALGLKLNGSPARVYAILGDGELDEGTVWEAIMSAPKFQLDNLCAVHDLQELTAAFDAAETFAGAPTVILAHTVKGKGVSFMEGKAAWHGKAIDDESFAQAMKELGGANA